MSILTDRQKQLLFDYCIGLTSEQEAAEAQKLLSVSEEAAGIYAKIKASLSPLDTLEDLPCPDELVEGTIWRLNNLASSSQLQLQQLLANEQARGVAPKRTVWRNLGEMVATAAVILFVAGVLLPMLRHAREDYWRHSCQMQLKRIGQGITNYIADYDGSLPTVATTLGSPWWKVGDQGDENHSNTRNAWLLAKEGYVNPVDFVCPGRSQGRVTRLDPQMAEFFNDFPARRYITYSFRIRCPQSANKLQHGKRVLISDLNPLFETLPRNYSQPLRIKLTRELLNFNSANHRRRGQNILFCDGSVDFAKSRHVGISQDDIYTLQNTHVYQGVEVPSCETDAFLAP